MKSENVQRSSYPQMATIEEAAAIFHLAPHFIRSRARQGADWVIKAGRKYLVNCDRLAAFLNGDGYSEEIKSKKNQK